MKIELWGGARDGEVIELPIQLEDSLYIRVGLPQGIGCFGTYKYAGAIRRGVHIYRVVKEGSNG